MRRVDIPAARHATEVHADHRNDPAHNETIVNPWHAVRSRKVRLDAIKSSSDNQSKSVMAEPSCQARESDLEHVGIGKKEFGNGRPNSQYDMNRGTGLFLKRDCVTPPSTISRSRE